MTNSEYVGKRRFKDLETGEIIEMDYIRKKVERGLKGGWRRVYMGDFLAILDEIGNAKIKVLEYVLNTVDSNNKIGKTMRQIAKEAGVSLFTVQSTFSALYENGLLKKIDNFYVVMPDIVSSFGSDAKNARLITEYSDYDASLFDEQD